VLDAAQNAQGLGLVLTTQISPLNSRILHLRLRSNKERLRRAQEAIKRLWKWSGTSNPREWGWSGFYRESEKLVVGAIRLDRSDRSTIPVRPVGWPQLGSGYSLKETLWISKFGLRAGHVRLWPDLFGEAQISTVILFTGHVQEMALEVGKGTGQVRWTGLALGLVKPVWPVCNTGLTGMTDFSTLLEFCFLTSLMESLWILSTLVLSRSPCCIPLYSTATYIQERNKTNKNKLELVNLILLCAIFIFV
jgi:hypothetical protein